MDHLFLRYANNPFQNTPKNLHKVFSSFDFDLFLEPYGDLVRKTIDDIVKIAEYEISNTNQDNILDELESQFFSAEDYSTEYVSQPVPIVWFRSAVDAVFGFSRDDYGKYDLGSDIYCRRYCAWRKERQKALGAKSFRGAHRLKCYECDQMFFINILQNIVARKEYSKIKGFENITIVASLSPLRTFKIDTTGSKDQKLKESVEFVPVGYRMNRSDGSFSGRFRTSIYGLIGYSLIDFLLHHDRNKLKLCDACHKLYVSKTHHPSRFCNTKCRLAYHNRKRIQSGEAKEYKRKKRLEGAKKSYYG